MSIRDDSYYYSRCKACGQKLNGINDFTDTHVLEEHPIKENYKYQISNIIMKVLNTDKFKVNNSFYGTFCWNYVRPDEVEVTEFRDEYDDLCDKTTEETKETLMETIRSRGWKYIKSEEIPSDDL